MKRSEYRALIQDIITEHNRVRENPQSYIPILEKEMKFLQGNILSRPGEIPLITHEGESVYQEAIEFLKNQEPLHTLEFDTKLTRAAQDHADDLGSHGITGHEGSNGSTMDSRISTYIDWDVTISENIDFGSITPEGIISSLIVDDGIESRGHRLNIFNPKVKFVGVGIGPHPEYEHCVVFNYCAKIVKYTERGNEVDEENELEDPDAPEDYVSCVTKVVPKTVKGKVQKKIVKSYKLRDGTTQINEFLQ